MENIDLKQLQDFLCNTDLKLKPSQSRLCWPVLLRIIDKIKRGARFGPIHVVDDIIVNGHHRFVAYSIMRLPIKTATWRRSEANLPLSWKEITIDMEDWDNPEDAERHELSYFPKP